MSIIDNNIYGGDISYKRTPWLLIIIAVIFIIFIIYEYNQYFESNRIAAYKCFNQLHGEQYDDTAKQVITNGELITYKYPYDHYMLGTVYLHNSKELVKAHAHFNSALNKIIDKPDTNAKFIIDRIDHFRDAFVDYDVNELPIEQALNITRQRERSDNIKFANEKKQLFNTDPLFTQKALLTKQTWHSDSQNVHDSSMYSLLTQQLNNIIDENAKIPNAVDHTYGDAIRYLQDKYVTDADKKNKMQLVINNLAHNYPTCGVKEQDIITAIWRRAHDPENAEHADEIKNSLGEAMLDCVEGNGLVCMAGRTSKYWQALARLDKNEETGVLKTKQALKNEIYEHSAKIVNDYLKDTSDELRIAYQKGEETEQVKELSASIKADINAIAANYKHLPDGDVSSVINECIAVI